MSKELRQFNPEHDKNETNEERIVLNLETHLKERFHVLLSKVNYEIIDGHLVEKGYTDPFINTIERGRDYIQSFGSTPEDNDRENGEVVGFEEMDSFFSDPETPLGSKTISISPKGGKYQLNFHDVLTLKSENGKRYVELSRYSSALSKEEYVNRLNLDPEKYKSAADFLANPIKVENVIISAEQIHQELHKEHDYMKVSEFGEIWKVVGPSIFVRNYLRRRDGGSFNAILNFADDVWENNKLRKDSQSYKDYTNYLPSFIEIKHFEQKEVRQVAGGCPGSSGADILGNSLKSVSEFGMHDKYGERKFTCPSCGKINVRPRDELLSNCQHCGSDKVACKEASSEKSAA